MFLGVQLIPEIAEVHLERRIAHDEIKLLQRSPLPVIWVQHRVALDDVGNGMNQIIQDEIEAQQAG